MISGMERAASKIFGTITRREPIGIFGDFDADGLTGAAILTRGIRELGGNAMPYIPVRERDGHGLTDTGIHAFKNAGIRLLITVDTGTNDRDKVALATRSGIEVIITDHHLPDGPLPESFATINPGLAGNGGGTILSGAGVALKVMQATFTLAGWEMPRPFFELAAIGTIADSMPLIDENRIIVSHGLANLTNTVHPGLKAMLDKIPGISKFSQITPETVAFYIGPRINAPGRLADSEPSLQLLTTNSQTEAHILAGTIEDLNTERRKLSAELEQVAIEALSKQHHQAVKFIQCIDYPIGLLGPLAGRVAEANDTPAVAYTISDGLVRASVRSRPQFDIHAALVKIKHLLAKFGGHHQAAGFTATATNLDEISVALNTLATHSLVYANSMPNKDVADAEVTLSKLTPRFWDAVMRFAPFGKGNPAPVFLARGLQVHSAQRLGNGNKHLRLLLSSNGDRPLEAIGFGLGNADFDNKVDVLFSLRTDVWKGRSRNQLGLVGLRRAK